ncbi:MAG TPA: hypothetical protein VE591_15185 [Candidatus Acidoferrum sp.]|nr:hypothetical protein [Candidatus Acidoferrum sp.]
MIAALVLGLASIEAAPMPTVPANPAWCARHLVTALDLRTPGVPYRLTGLQVEGRYALASWSFRDSAGEAAFIRTDAGWCVLSSGGGTMGVQGLVESGVPRDVALRLYRAAQRKDARK